MAKYYCRVSVNGKKIRSYGAGSKKALMVSIISDMSEIKFDPTHIGEPTNTYVFGSNHFISLEFIKRTKSAKRKYMHVYIFESDESARRLNKNSEIFNFDLIEDDQGNKVLPMIVRLTRFIIIVFREESLKYVYNDK